MSATRKQPSRGNKGGSTTMRGLREEDSARASSHRKSHTAHARVIAENSPQASTIQRELGQGAQAGQGAHGHAVHAGQTQTQTEETQTQGQRARRRPSRSQQPAAMMMSSKSKSTTTSTASSSAPTTALPPTTTSTATTPSVSTATASTTSNNNINPLPSSTTPSTTTVKRTLDVAPPTVGPKGIMHDKMVHVSFHSVPETPTSAPPSNRTTRAQKREERLLHQRDSQPMDHDDTDSDSDSPRVRGLFDYPLLPPKKPRRKLKHPTASTKNPPDVPPGSLPTVMDLDLKSTVAQQHPPTPLSAQPLPSPGQPPASYWIQPWVCPPRLLPGDFASSSVSRNKLTVP